MADTRLRLTIEADSAKAEADLKEIQGYADRLEADDLTLLVQVRTEAAEANIKALRRKLADVSDEGDVKVVLQGIDKAQSELRELQNLAEKPASKKFSMEGIREGAAGLADMAGSAESLPGPLGAAAGFLSGPAGIAGLAAAAGVGMFSMAQNTADSAADAEALSAAVGGTVEETSRLLAATGSVGLDYQDLLELISESNNAIQDNEQAAKDLGVAIGGTPIERFQDLVDAVYKIPDPMTRARTAAKFFGEEGSKQLPRLIGMYGDLSTAIESVPEAAVISEQDAAAAKEFSLAIADFKAQVGVLAAELGKYLIPKLAEVAEGATNAAEFVNKAGGQAATAWDWVSDPAFAFKATFLDNDTKVDMKEVATLGGDVKTAMDGVATSVLSSMGALDQSGQSYEQLTTNAELTAEAVKTYAGYQDDAKESLDKFLGSVEKARNLTLTQAEATLRAARSQQDLADAITEAREEGGISRQETEKINDELMQYADLTLQAKGLTQGTAEGMATYNKALLGAASTLGDTLTPEIVDYIAVSANIPEETVTEIKGLIAQGKFVEAAAILKKLDDTTVIPDIKPDYKKEAAERAKADAAELDRTVASPYVYTDYNAYGMNVAKGDAAYVDSKKAGMSAYTNYNSYGMDRARSDADSLDGRNVRFNVEAHIVRTANDIFNSIFGGRATTSATARNQNRNG